MYMMYTKLHVLLAPILMIGIYSISASNVLIVPAMSSGSHYTIMMAIAEQLVNRGHNVTVLVESDKLTASNDRYYYEYLTPVLSNENKHALIHTITKAGIKGHRLSALIAIMSGERKKRTEGCHKMLSDKQLLQRLRNANFDLSIVDTFNKCPIVQYLRKFMGIQYVTVSNIHNLPALSCLDNRLPVYPSYMPAPLSLGLGHVMSFRERCVNVLSTIITNAILFLVFNVDPDVTSIRSVYNLSDTTPFYSDAELHLVNTHFVLDFARPLMPNVIAVGGLTTKQSKPLENEWIDFLESAGEDGVVLFSMGSYATGIDEDVAGLFAGAFAQLPQKVIWKLNGKPSATLTPNVKVVDWIPQNDLLGHPQIKAFVYHCGVNGVWEAVYHGVPMVAVPLFGDQYDNAQRLVSRGMAVKVDISTLTSDELAQAIRTVIKDPSYKNNATRISAIFRDSPRTPPEVAVDWIEYVIRHGGAKHLRSAALDLNIFQYLLLDVIAVLLLAFITLMIILYCSCRLCFRGCRRLCGGSNKVKSE
ncbi:UDP-glucuronosyltransferase 2C1-like isoform X3 [Amphiura filiformis]|uniref:UDP-glucuronosyltransferase 2C1-like isoform X3 n=1 Tax=Amphiura filiformis TaxID=82378 RepID=UPI003B22217A